MSRRGSRLAPLATSLTLALALGLSACGDDAATVTAEPSSSASSGSSTPDSSTPDSETPESETPDSVAITLTRESDAFTPNGERVDAAAGQTVVLTITADEPGELHVHSVPEQEISYDAGTSEHEITIDRPGVVEVESHDPDLVVLQLEVR